jgi:hypothetical protein
MNHRLAVTVVTLGVFAMASSGYRLRGAGTNAVDEASIRKLIADNDKAGSARMPSLSNHIFWSGAYKRPIVDMEKGELTREDAAENRINGSEKSKTNPIRIVVSDSRDMAYEYSKDILEYDLKNGKHMSFTLGLLRVWQKQGGEWKEAAVFSRPYEN